MKGSFLLAAILFIPNFAHSEVPNVTPENAHNKGDSRIVSSRPLATEPFNPKKHFGFDSGYFSHNRWLVLDGKKSYQYHDKKKGWLKAVSYEEVGPEGKTFTMKNGDTVDAIEGDIIFDAGEHGLYKAMPPVTTVTRETSAQEEAVAKLVAEKRTVKLIRDPRLDAAARERACASASVDFNSHTDQFGRGPNYYVKKNGFPFTGADNQNGVESIAWGYQTAGAAWAKWMDSPPHHAHIMGLGFSAGHTHFGVGHCKRPGRASGPEVWTILSAAMPPGKS